MTISIRVACDAEDATVTVHVDGLLTTASTCFFDPSITRGETGADVSTMQTAVDQDAAVTVTTEPHDARWSAAISTSP